MRRHAAPAPYVPGKRIPSVGIVCVLAGGKMHKRHARLVIEATSALAVMVLSVLCAMSDLGWLSGPAVNAPLLAQAFISYRYRI